MLDFMDTKSFGAAFVGVVTLATGLEAGVADWALLALPLSAMVGYLAIHRQPR
jgi:hypothetical protein